MVWARLHHVEILYWCTTGAPKSKGSQGSISVSLLAFVTRSFSNKSMFHTCWWTAFEVVMAHPGICVEVGLLVLLYLRTSHFKLRLAVLRVRVSMHSGPR